MKSRVRLKAEELLNAGHKLSKYDLATLAPCDQRTAQRILSSLRLITVKWIKVYKQWIPVYAIEGKSKARPKPLTQHQRNYKRLCDPEYMINEMMRKRHKRLIDKHELQSSNKRSPTMDI